MSLSMLSMLFLLSVIFLFHLLCLYQYTDFYQYNYYYQFLNALLFFSRIIIFFSSAKWVILVKQNVDNTFPAQSLPDHVYGTLKGNWGNWTFLKMIITWNLLQLHCFIQRRLWKIMKRLVTSAWKSGPVQLLAPQWL